MKYHYLSRVLTAFFAMLALVITPLARAKATPTDEGVPLNIDVRSSVDQRWKGMSKGGAIAHGKLYALVSVKDVSTEVKLIKPVDENALLAHLRRELDKNGFREIAAGQKPEIVLTITYGRGFLRNPYMDDMMIDEHSPGSAPSATITSPKQAMRQRGFNAEAKMQSAQNEKLYVAVTAWQYPEKKGAKPYQFWRTLMAVDNPDGRDLNLALPAMFAAGVGYFDREMKEPEVTINSTMPTGTVKLGPLDVIEENVPKK